MKKAPQFGDEVCVRDDTEPHVVTCVAGVLGYVDEDEWRVSFTLSRPLAQCVVPMPFPTTFEANVALNPFERTPDGRSKWFVVNPKRDRAPGQA